MEILDRRVVTELVIEAKVARGLSWAALAEALDAPLVWSTAALLGQHPLSAEQAGRAVGLLGLPPDAAAHLQRVPVRGPRTPAIAADPTVYRLQEAVNVYGETVKELVHEEFGDGIMSAINFHLDVARAAHPGGDRVVITLDGKFLPYDWA